MEHFGIKLINRGKGFKLTKENFATISTKPSLPYFKSLKERNAYTDDYVTTYSKCWCSEYRKLCLKNFDLNMEYFSKLDKIEFSSALSSFLLEFKEFKEVSDLQDFSGVEGYYIMVLDEYKQAYIGKSSDIRKRIMKHWSATIPFDRTLFPMYAWDKSTFSIDFFRALDTTRIYIWEKKNSDSIEANLINKFPHQYLTNRIGGDITTALEALATTNFRQL